MLWAAAAGAALVGWRDRAAALATLGALGIDGAFGPATRSALIRFRRLYALQDDDCTPVNFSYAELNNCNSNWSGGNVSAATALANALVSMWKLPAMRHALGDQPMRVTSGFRSVARNQAVGGVASRAPGARDPLGDDV